MTAAYALGRDFSSFREGENYSIDLVVTEGCNLRCSYCYLTGKNDEHPMTAQVARDAVDFFLKQPVLQNAVMWNMIGGEALIAMDVIEEAVEYFKSRACQLNHPWRYGYIIMLSTNGVLYDDPRVQAFLFKNRHHVYPGMTLDGTKRKHDMHRFFPDGRGSYDIVVENMKLALRQFPHLGTKVTFSHSDLQYVCESIVHLWELGITRVAANVVFEDVWMPGDSEIFEAQLRELADVALDRGFWRTHGCSLFWVPNNDIPDMNVCGTGNCASVDWRGDLHACIRFTEHSLAGSGKSVRPIGSIYTGIDSEALRSFKCLRRSLMSPAKCLECEVQDGCSWCLGHCFEEANTDTIFHRATALCDMHKARWRINQYYWQQLKQRHGIEIPSAAQDNKACLI